MNIYKLMKNYFKIILLLFVIGFILLTYNYKKIIEEPKSVDNSTVIFEVKQGENVDMIAKNLFEKDLLISEYYFKKYIKKESYGTSLQAGTYKLSPILSIKDIVRVFVNGETLNKEKTIKFIEGWNMKDMNEYLLENKILYNNDFLDLASMDIEVLKTKLGDYDFFSLLPLNINLEGFLFPDTYSIFNDANASDIIMRMLNNFDSKISAEMKADIKKQGRSLHEVMTLASIVEKEVQSKEDMKLVAGLFLNRIKNGQALESCATLAYILGVNKKQYTIEDTQIVSPYNTYRNQGLPPGPICNPGINAIEAAIYPSPSDYNYFLSSFKDGKTIFSKTYNEHLGNKTKYLQ